MSYGQRARLMSAELLRESHNRIKLSVENESRAPLAVADKHLSALLQLTNLGDFEGAVSFISENIDDITSGESVSLALFCLAHTTTIASDANWLTLRRRFVDLQAAHIDGLMSSLTQGEASQ
jgi:hypothetical protein